MASANVGGGLLEALSKSVGGVGGDDPYAVTPENKIKVSGVLDKFLRVNSASRTGFEWGWFRNLCLIAGAHDIVKLDGQVKIRPMPKGYPRTLTNKFREKYSDLLSALVQGRVPIKHLPATDDDEAHATAEIGERVRDVIYAEAGLDEKESEIAEWFLSTGNVFLHPYYDYDPKYGTTPVPKMVCAGCGGTFGKDDLEPDEDDAPASPDVMPSTPVTPGPDSMDEPPDDANDTSGIPNTCPTCAAAGTISQLAPSATETELSPIGALCVEVLSGFEVRGDMRIRDVKNWPWFVEIKRYDLQYAKEKLDYNGGEEDEAGAGADGNSLAQHYLDVISSLNDQFNPRSSFGNTNQTSKVPKVTGYKLYMLPTEDFPEGLCVTRVGKSAENVVEIKPLDSEYGVGIKKGQKFLPLVHGKCSPLPGRMWASTPLDDIVPLQYFRNRVERSIDAELRRMSGSAWMNPKGSGVDNFAGDAGQIINYNPVLAGGTVPIKPERIVPQLQYLQQLIMMLKQIDDQIERVVGTYYVEGGESAPNVTAASALALLDQNKKKAMGPMVRAFAKMYLALDEMTLELARKYWTDTRIRVAAGKNKAWEVATFMSADLQGAISMEIDYQSLFPASEATERAEIEQLIQGGIINPQDPEQKYEVLRKFGKTSMAGSTDKHTRVARIENSDFLKFVTSNGGQDAQGQPVGKLPEVTPMMDNSMIHIVEHVQFGNTDEFRALPSQAKQVMIEHITAHYVEEGQKRGLMAELQMNPDAPGAVDITTPGAQAAMGAAQQSMSPPGGAGTTGNQVGSRTPKGTTGNGPNQAKAANARGQQVMTQSPHPDLADGAANAVAGR